MSLQENLDQADQQIGGGVKTKLLVQKGRLKGSEAETAEDVTGFDNIITDGNGKCYTFYAANPPLVGLTQPTPCPCPLGAAAFDGYKIDYKGAIDIFHKGNWGSKFNAISVGQALTPEVKDPHWRIMSTLGTEVVINANTGEVEQ